jgi:hypothetical protein
MDLLIYNKVPGSICISPSRNKKKKLARGTSEVHLPRNPMTKIENLPLTLHPNA